MRRAVAAILLAVALLAGCGGKGFWLVEPSPEFRGIYVGSDGPGGPHRASDSSLFQPWASSGGSGQWDRPILPPIGRLKRNDPDERPRLVTVRLSATASVQAKVYDENCFEGEVSPYTDVPNRTVWLCGKPSAEKHELAHVVGMEHGPWEVNGMGACTTVRAPGYDTGYAAGDDTCVVNDYEIVTKR